MRKIYPRLFCLGHIMPIHSHHSKTKQKTCNLEQVYSAVPAKIKTNQTQLPCSSRSLILIHLLFTPHSFSWRYLVQSLHPHPMISPLCSWDFWEVRGNITSMCVSRKRLKLKAHTIQQINLPVKFQWTHDPWGLEYDSLQCMFPLGIVLWKKIEQKRNISPFANFILWQILLNIPFAIFDFPFKPSGIPF